MNKPTAPRAIQSVAVVYNQDKDGHREALEQIRRLLERRGTGFSIIEHRPSESEERAHMEDIRRRVRKADAVVVLGGDGTLLGVGRVIAREPKPILGINLGSFGFLTTIHAGDMECALDRLISGEYEIVNRFLLETRISRTDGDGDPGENFCELALNEALITLSRPGRLVNLRLEENGQPALNYRCDGLIVATPTGSSGHSLSAGGPILEPHLAALVITPVSPHSLFNRPLVIDGRRELCIRFNDDTLEQKVLILDGQIHARLESRDALYIRRSPHKVATISLPGQSFIRVLRQKFNIGGPLGEP